MKLDRNINGTGRGKYGLIKTRRLAEIESCTDINSIDYAMRQQVQYAIDVLKGAGILDWGPAGTESEFFVIKLRDVNARAAIDAYADSADSYGAREYARDVAALALRAGPASPFCKKPD